MLLGSIQSPMFIVTDQQQYRSLKMKIKEIFFLPTPSRGIGGSGGIAPLILNVGTSYK
jgi:hypothetical protein